MTQSPEAYSPDDQTHGLALYIHWPFCVSKCPYCDFNSHIREAVDQDAWRVALVRDLMHEAELTKEGTVTSLFFGGGTPSLMPPDTIAALIDAAGRHWRLADDVEITLEANPSSVEAARFADLARAGVNRLSLGIQSFDDDALRFLGRPHSAAEGLAALDTAQSHFKRVSFDLIYALPGQRPGDWREQLIRALGFGTGHLSLYQLTIEPGTRFASLAAKGELTPLDPEPEAELFEITRALTQTAGLPAYEISNHARPGEECRHNLSYWRYDDYIGVGPGAHGRRTGIATERHRKPENWLDAINRNGHGLRSEQRLDRQERALEALMMGLRLTEGISDTTFERRTGKPLDAILDSKELGEAIDLGLIERWDDRLRCTDQGRLVLNTLLERLVRTDPALAAA